jgi:hypothetical protein
VLTDLGRATIEAAAPGHVEDVRALFIDLLTDEQLDQLTALAEQVLVRLDAVQEEDCAQLDV